MYTLTKSPLYQLSNKKKLITLLHIEKTPKIIEKILKNKSMYYSEFSKYIKGKFRPIQAPKNDLKFIQNRIKILLARIETPKFLFSGQKNINCIDNAKFHRNFKYTACFDIEKFFNNVSDKKIYLCLKHDFKISSDIAKILTDLISYNNCLPTGAPCSSIVAYWTFNRLFNNINNYCQSRKIIFSLYVDDIAISSNTNISSSIKKTIEDMLCHVNLNIKSDKNKKFLKNEDKEITGCVVKPNGELKIPKVKKEEILAMSKIINKYSDKKDKDKFIGKLNYARQIEPDFLTKKYTDLLNKIKK